MAIKTQTIRNRFVVAHDDEQTHGSNVLTSEVFNGEDIVGKKVLVGINVTEALTIATAAANVYVRVLGSFDGVNFGVLAQSAQYIPASTTTTLTTGVKTPLVVDLTGFNVPFIKVQIYPTAAISTAFDDTTTYKNITGGKAVTTISY